MSAEDHQHPLRRSSVMDLPLRQLNRSDDQIIFDHHHHHVKNDHEDDDHGDDASTDSSDGSINFPSVRRLPTTSSSTGDDKTSDVSQQQQHLRRRPAAALLIYHESAREIVFRDHLRRAGKNSSNNAANDDSDDMHSLYLSIRSLERRNSFDEGTKMMVLQQRRNSLDDEQQQQQPQDDLCFLSSSASKRSGRADGDFRASFRATASFDAKSMIRESLLENSSSPSSPSNSRSTPHTVGYISAIRPLPPLILTPENHFHPLFKEESSSSNMKTWTVAERHVVEMLQQQRACVKTIKNTEWSAFLERFVTPQLKNAQHGRFTNQLHDDIPPSSSSSSSQSSAALPTEHNRQTNESSLYPWNSFVTSTTLLPPNGKKMRCYGSTTQYTTGVVFALPTHFADEQETEDAICAKTETWSWPAGYSAKTEFNIDGRGKLINGRQEALCPLSVLRQYNIDYLTKDEYLVGTRLVSGMNQIPYNEVFLRVGGLGGGGGPVSVGGGGGEGHEEDSEGAARTSDVQRLRSFDRGVGLPVALFVRTATYGDLISMLRSRARMIAVLGRERNNYLQDLPLLLITPQDGVRVFTRELQLDMLDIASRRLNPFQNSTIAYKTTIDNTTEEALQQKVEELIDLDQSIREALSPRQLAVLVGGIGATDESVATIMKQVMIFDIKANRKEHRHNERHGRHGSSSRGTGTSHRLQNFVMEGLTAAVRAGDYYTARQILILYSLVASRADELFEEVALDDSLSEDVSNSEIDSSSEHNSEASSRHQRIRRTNPKKMTAQRVSGLGRGAKSLLEEMQLVKKKDSRDELLSRVPAPPLKTDHLRASTNSFGLLTVLGAAQILRAMQDGSCKRRLKESVSAVEEWVDLGEKSIAFRIASWNDQRAAQGDLHIATEQNSKFMAFVGTKAISNRKAFAGQMRQVLTVVKFTSVETLQGINLILSKMHSPCLRLELLQYVLGLDSRYSVEHCKRSVELAATCLSMAHDELNDGTTKQ